MTAREHRTALRAPTARADRREAVRDFVADIPVTPADPSYRALRACAAVLDEHPRPTLLLWGGRDPVFHDRFLADLRARIPGADVERFPDAAHLVTLDAPVGPVVARWLAEVGDRSGPTGIGTRWCRTDGPGRAVHLAARLSRDRHERPVARLRRPRRHPRLGRARCPLARSAPGPCRTRGLRPGDRVSLLVPPSCELLVAAGAVWKAGGVPVVADASAGLRQLRRLVRAAAPGS